MKTPHDMFYKFKNFYGMATKWFGFGGFFWYFF